MKKRFLILLLLLALVLSACGDRTTIHLVEYDNHLLTLDTANDTITEGDTVYRYEISDWGGSTRYTIFYPDGASYSMAWSDGIGGGGGDELYYAESRLDGGGLIDIVTKYEKQTQKQEPANIGVGLLVILLGIFYAAAPYAAWYIGHGWRFENAEPSELYLAMLRIGGIILIIAGLLAIFIL